MKLPESELHVRFSRARGPGGQNVNKRDTRVEVLFDVGASRALSNVQKARALERLGRRLDAHGRLRVSSEAARTQGANRAAAVARLTALLEDAVKPPPRPRKRTKPSAGATERRIKEKKQRGEVKRSRARVNKDAGD